MEYSGKTVVVKYGGAAMQSGSLKALVCEDAAALAGAGARLVLVHGGGPELSALMRQLGKEPRFVDGLRYTDAQTVDAALMALAGSVNKSLVARLQAQGARAVGLCGVDGGMIRAEKLEEPDLGFVGKVASVDAALLKTVLDAGYIPVIATVGLGADGQIYNINADTAAGALAAALHADRLVSMSDVRGVLRGKDDENSLIPEIGLAELDGLIAAGVVTGGMIPKVGCCAEAIKAGVAEASIIDGRVPHALLRELGARPGIGTTFVA
jgi:acetylglutamate kinase